MSNSYPIVLSFDVGIVYLSYCLLTQIKDVNNNINRNILDWGNIDLTNRNHICHCGAKASYTNIIDNIEYYYCKIHSKNII